MFHGVFFFPDFSLSFVRCCCNLFDPLVAAPKNDAMSVLNAHLVRAEPSMLDAVLLCSEKNIYDSDRTCADDGVCVHGSHPLKSVANGSHNHPCMNDWGKKKKNKMIVGAAQGLFVQTTHSSTKGGAKVVVPIILERLLHFTKNT